MSPQPSNRDVLVEGALRCLQRLPPDRITSRAIATEAGANPASIAYHFGSKDDLLTEAAILGLDRWLETILDRLASQVDEEAPATLPVVAREVEATQDTHRDVIVHYVLAVARSTHDARIRHRLVEGYRRARPAVASILGLEQGQAGQDAAGLLLAMFHGVMIQRMLDDTLMVPGERMTAALERLGQLLQQEPAAGSPQGGSHGGRTRTGGRAQPSS